MVQMIRSVIKTKILPQYVFKKKLLKIVNDTEHITNSASKMRDERKKYNDD